MASYIVERQAHYHFTAKGNQPGLQRDIALPFDKRGPADFVEAARASGSSQGPQPQVVDE